MTTDTATQLHKTIKTRDDWGWIYRIILALAITAYWLYSDRHNDERYVQQAQYHQDIVVNQQEVARTAKELAEETARLAATVARSESKHDNEHDILIQMSQDIKWLKEKSPSK